MSIKEQAALMKNESILLAGTSLELRNSALQNIINELEANKETILTANNMDIEKAKAGNTSPALLKRLIFDEDKLSTVISGIRDLILLPDPLAKIQLKRELNDGLTLVKESCPIGVIGIIFEARPDALVQISSLCIKSGNCAILKGGSEAYLTNSALFAAITKACADAGLPKNSLFLATAREEVSELLSCHESIDLLVPRGSNSFVSYIMNNTKIPVMGHADGICHIYVDENYDIDKALKIIFDAKTQYVAACNTVETLLVNKKIAADFLPAFKAYIKDKVLIKGDSRCKEFIACEAASEEDFDTEYSDYIISVKVVDTLEDAINHINLHGSHHTDCIISEDKNSVQKFMQYVDSAGVYHNVSTRFADGYRYGFGAELGISTGKIHARGPVGLEGLCTSKYKLFGNGDIVSDYAEGKKQFHFRDLI